MRLREGLEAESYCWCCCCWWRWWAGLLVVGIAVAVGTALLSRGPEAAAAAIVGAREACCRYDLMALLLLPISGTLTGSLLAEGTVW